MEKQTSTIQPTRNEIIKGEKVIMEKLFDVYMKWEEGILQEMNKVN